MPICERCMNDVGKDGIRTDEGLWICRRCHNATERARRALERKQTGQARPAKAETAPSPKANPVRVFVLAAVLVGFIVWGLILLVWLIGARRADDGDALRKELEKRDRDSARALDSERLNAERAADRRRVDNLIEEQTLRYQAEQARREAELRRLQEQEMERRRRMEQGW